MWWRQSIQRLNKYDRFAYLLLALIPVSVALSLRFIASASTILLLAAVLVHPERKNFTRKIFSDPLFLFLLALLLLQLAGLFYTSDKEMGWKEVVKKAGIAIIPFFFAAFRRIPAGVLRLILIAFTAGLSATALSCLILAVYRYQETGDITVFFYHELVAPFKHHAIFFSFFLFYCIVYWLDQPRNSFLSRNGFLMRAVVILFFLVLIVLLSSKLVIILTFLYLLYFIFRTYYHRQKKWVLLAAALMIVVAAGVFTLTENPVRHRFQDMVRGNDTLFRQEKFSTDIYFNGLQFRLLTWRFTHEILYRENAWLLGVGPGDAQHHLDKRYLETNMYLGEGPEKDGGFRGFNAHNVFLQTTLESGLAGLALLIGAIGAFYCKAIKRRKQAALVFFTAMVLFGLTESVLSTQYAILLFLFFPLLILSEDRRN